MANQTWLRLYTEVTRDRKLRRLPVSYRWIWITILCMAKESPDPGKLLLSEGVPVEIEDIADEAAVDMEEVKKAIDIFINQKMVHKEDGILVITNWGKRQFESDNSTQRWRKWYERQKANNNQTLDQTEVKQKSNVGQTFSDTDTDIQIQSNNINNNSSSSSSSQESNVGQTFDDDDDDEFIKIKGIYEENFGQAKPLVIQRIRELLAYYGTDLMTQAIYIAVQNKAGGIRYIEKTLSDWEKNGIKNINDLEQKGKIIVLRPKEQEIDENAVSAAAKYIELELSEFTRKERSEQEIIDFLNSSKFRYPPLVKKKALERLGLAKYAEG